MQIIRSRSLSEFLFFLVFAFLAIAGSVRAELPYSIVSAQQFSIAGFTVSNSVNVDASGNIQVGGFTGSPNSNAFLRDYDSSGNVLWTRQFGSDYDATRAIGSDASGNIYVDGYIDGFEGTGVSLAKYNAAGALVWTNQYGTPDNHYNAGPIALEGSGNFATVVTTYTSGVPTASLLKYGSSGNLTWSRTVNTMTADIAGGVAIDNLGNVFLSGSTLGNVGGANVGGDDIFVRKYDSSGNLLWSRQVGSSGDEFVMSMAASSNGSIFITGYTTGNLAGLNAGSRDAFLLKYDGSGNLLWSRQFGTSTVDNPDSVAVDASGNAYIAGEEYGSLSGPNAGSSDAFLTKFDGSGNLLWNKQFGTSALDRGLAVAVDGSGNPYVTGDTQGNLFGTANGNEGFLAEFAPVPEPSTLALLALGSLGLLVRRKLARRLIHS
jgi:hypothetical protein